MLLAVDEAEVATDVDATARDRDCLDRVVGARVPTRERVAAGRRQLGDVLPRQATDFGELSAGVNGQARDGECEREIRIRVEARIHSTARKHVRDVASGHAADGGEVAADEISAGTVGGAREHLSCAAGHHREGREPIAGGPVQLCRRPGRRAQPGEVPAYVCQPVAARDGVHVGIRLESGAVGRTRRERDRLRRRDQRHDQDEECRDESSSHGFSVGPMRSTVQRTGQGGPPGLRAWLRARSVKRTGLTMDSIARMLHRSLVTGAAAVAAALAVAPMAQAVPDPLAFETGNGSVLAVAPGDGVTYVGGSFAEVQAHAERAVRVSTATGKRNAPSPAVNGVVNADRAGRLRQASSLAATSRRSTACRAWTWRTSSPMEPLTLRGTQARPDGFATPQVKALAVADGAVLHRRRVRHRRRRGTRAASRRSSATTGNVFHDLGSGRPALQSMRSTISGSALRFIGGDFSDVGGNTRFGAAKVSDHEMATSSPHGSRNPDRPGRTASRARSQVDGAAVYFGRRFHRGGGQQRSVRRH